MADAKKLAPGQILYSVERHRMGNTTMRTISVYEIVVVEVDPEGRWVFAKWNHNSPMRFYRAAWSRWKIKKPITVKSAFGSQRLATREEIAALRKELPQHSPRSE